MTFLNKFLGRTPKSSNVAKDRLQLVLVQDRIKLTPYMMDTLRGEIIEVISKYVDIDPKGIDISLSKSARQSHLVANVPLLGSKSGDMR